MPKLQNHQKIDDKILQEYAMSPSGHRRLSPPRARTKMQEKQSTNLTEKMKPEPIKVQNDHFDLDF